MDAILSPTLDRRAWLAAAAVFVATPVLAACPPVRVLFVCGYGSVKSPFARELMRRKAGARGVAVELKSRGLTPDAHADAGFLQRAMAEGLDLDRQAMSRLEPSDIAAADVVVSFEPPIEAGLPKARDWSDTPSMLGAYDAARSVIDRRIESLLDEIAARRC
jgi:hypothetical protein